VVRDLCRQYNRKPCRCQPNNVSGLTMASASLHRRAHRANKTSMPRSRRVSCGRFTCRCRMITCWRSSAFSAINSSPFRVISVNIPPTSDSVLGFVQCLNRSSTFRMMFATQDLICCANRLRNMGVSFGGRGSSASEKPVSEALIIADLRGKLRLDVFGRPHKEPKAAASTTTTPIRPASATPASPATAPQKAAASTVTRRTSAP